MKHILVPTDFSFCANKALDYAVCLAKKSGAEIHLLHACELIHNPFQDRKDLVDEYNNAVQINANKQLEAIQKSIEETEHVTLVPHLYDGGVIETILQAADSKDLELIVIGTVGRTGWGHKIMGSRTAELLSKTRVPVIAVPYEYEWLPPKHILLALNDPDEPAACLKPAFDIAELFDAEVNVAIFSGAHEEAIDVMEHSRALYSIRQKLQKAYDKVVIKAEHLSGSDFQEALQEYINKNNIDLLAMITHNRNKMQRLFHRSLTCKMSYHANVPLLALHA